MNEIYTCFCKISWLLRIPFGSHILKHMTRNIMVGERYKYYGKKSSTLNVELSTEIGFVWLLEWPKLESFQGLCPRTPVRPKWAPPRTYLSRNMRAWRPLEFAFQRSAHATTCTLKLKKKKIHNRPKVRQATKVQKIWFRFSVLKSVPAQGPTS